MNMKHRTALAAVIGLLIGATGTLAQEKAPEHVNRIWSFVPRAGVEGEFVKAFEAHGKWRTEHQDPWHWDIYVEVVGPNVGRRIARSPGHLWSDFDTYETSDFAAQAADNWNTTVAPFVGNATSVITRPMTDISNWPDEVPDYHLFQLSFYRVKIGHITAFRQTARALADTLKQAKWPYPWSFEEWISGGPVPTVLLAIPSLNWAGLAEPDPNVFEAISGQVGADKATEMFQAFAATYESIQSVIIQRQPQLTVPGAKQP